MNAFLAAPVVMVKNRSSVVNSTAPASAVVLTVPVVNFSGGYANIEIVNSDSTANNWGQLGFSDAHNGAYSALFGVQFTDHANNYGKFAFYTRAADGMLERLSIDNIGSSFTGTISVSGIGAIGGSTSSTTNLNLAAGTTGVSSLRIPHGAAPTTPVDGDLWTTTAGLYVRINGATVGPLT